MPIGNFAEIDRRERLFMKTLLSKEKQQRVPERDANHRITEPAALLDVLPHPASPSRRACPRPSVLPMPRGHTPQHTNVNVRCRS
jgi:hypothetical protein